MRDGWVHGDAKGEKRGRHAGAYSYDMIRGRALVFLGAGGLFVMRLTTNSSKQGTVIKGKPTLHGCCSTFEQVTNAASCNTQSRQYVVRTIDMDTRTAQSHLHAHRVQIHQSPWICQAAQETEGGRRDRHNGP
jgi:hypothetical protein